MKLVESANAARATARWLAIACESISGGLVLAFGLLGLRSFFVHAGRDLYFLSLVVGLVLVGCSSLAAAWLLLRRRYWGQLFLFMLPLAPFLLIATD